MAFEITAINDLSDAVLDEFCDRKRTGRIDLAYDVESGAFYGIPKELP